MVAEGILKVLVVLSCCSHAGSLKLNTPTNAKYLCGGTVELTCSVETTENSLALPSPLIWNKNGVLKSNCYDTTDNDCSPKIFGNAQFSSNLTKKEYYVKFTGTSLSDEGLWSCEATSFVTSSATISFSVLPDSTSKLTKADHIDKLQALQLDTNCLASDSNDSVRVEWEYKYKSSRSSFKAIEPEDEEKFAATVSCAAFAANCIGSTFHKFRKQAKFEYDDACGLTMRAKLTTTESFVVRPDPDFVYTDEITDVCIKGHCWWYRWVVLALFFCVSVVIFVSLVVYALSRSKVVPSWCMIVMLCILWMLFGCAVAMILVWIIECKDEPTWAYGLAVFSAIETVGSFIVFIYLLCTDGEPAMLLRKMYRREKMDEEERKRLAAVLVLIFWFPLPLPGLILLVPCCIKRGRFVEVVKMFWCHKDG